jgi:hypothetical protein
MRKPYELPEGIEYPKYYRKARKARRWFQVGAWDGVEGSAMADETDLRRRHGASAWEAYRRGYEAGQRQRAEQ